MKFLKAKSDNGDEMLEGSEHGAVPIVKYTSAYLADRYVDPRSLENASAVNHDLATSNPKLQSGSLQNLWSLRAELTRLSKEKEKLLEIKK